MGGRLLSLELRTASELKIPAASGGLEKVLRTRFRADEDANRRCHHLFESYLEIPAMDETGWLGWQIPPRDPYIPKPQTHLQPAVENRAIADDTHTSTNV